MWKILCPAISFALFLFISPVAEAAGWSFAALENLSIETGNGTHNFKIEYAGDFEARAQGLMHRRSLGKKRGMLFDFKRDQIIMMWMKNTHLSLDMIFITKYGTIRNIIKSTKPLSLNVVESKGKARAVLEINAGLAEQLGLKAGNRVRHRIFSSRLPASTD